MFEITLHVIFMLYIHTRSMSLNVLVWWPLMGLVTKMCNEGRFDPMLIQYMDQIVAKETFRKR